MHFISFHWHARLSALVLSVLLLIGSAQVGAQPVSTADSRFLPNPNGFDLSNWRDNKYQGDAVTADVAKSIYGDDVCVKDNADNACRATPATQIWLDKMNREINQGRCEGMAVLSAAFYRNIENSAEFGSAKVWDLEASGPSSQKLHAAIARYHVSQFLSGTAAESAETKSLNMESIVSRLEQALNASDDYIFLGIYSAQGGHSLLPYKVEKIAENQYRVHVYDSNLKGQVDRFVTVNTADNKWSYQYGALNASTPPTLWQGGQGSMDITTLNSRIGRFECPFCNGEDQSGSAEGAARSSAEPENITVLTPNRCSQVEAVSLKDKSILTEHSNGQENEIDDAYMVPLRGSVGCYISLPQDQQYNLKLVDDGLPFAKPSTELTVFAPGKVYAISNVALSRDTEQGFGISKDSFSYEAGGSQKPTLEVGDERMGYQVSGLTLRDGYQFDAKEDEQGRTLFSDNDPDNDDFDIKAEQIDASGTRSYDYENIDAGDNGQVILDDDAKNGLELDIDSDSDGIPNDADADDAKDSDDDGDGSADTEDSVDIDSDGMPDDVDADDDNDNIPDTKDSDEDGDEIK